MASTFETIHANLDVKTVVFSKSILRFFANDVEVLKNDLVQSKISTYCYQKKNKTFRVGPADNWQGYDFYSPPDSARRATIPSPKPTSISPLEIKGCKIQPKVS